MGGVTKFDGYMLSRLMALFGFFSLILVAIYWLNRAISLFDQLIADGQSGWVFLELTALTLPNVIRVVLPISAFIASVHITNRLSVESELVVMQSSGQSGFRLARPVAIFGMIIALLLLIVSNFIAPAANRTLAERQDDIARNVTARMLNEGRFLHPATGITFYIRDIAPGGELQDIYMSDRRDSEQPTIYTARRASITQGEDGPKLLMFDGLAQTLSAGDRKLFTTRFDDFAYDLGELVPASDRRWLRPREISTLELLLDPETAMDKTGSTRSEIETEVHERFAHPILAVVTALVGFACLLLGNFSRFGVWPQIVIAILLLIGIETLDNVIADIVRASEGIWPLLYLPALTGLGLGGIILWLTDKPTLRTNVAP